MVATADASFSRMAHKSATYSSSDAGLVPDEDIARNGRGGWEQWRGGGDGWVDCEYQVDVARAEILQKVNPKPLRPGSSSA
jgi:hypothetical protein